MNWPLSFVISVLTGIAGFFGTAHLSTFLIRWFRLASFQPGSASAYYAAALSVFGGIAGLFVGIICARIVAAQSSPGFFKALGVSLGTSLVILLIVALICRFWADKSPLIDGKSLNLLVEIQSPPSAVATLPRKLDNDYSAYASIKLRYGGKSHSTGMIELRTNMPSGHGKLFTATIPLQTSAHAKRLQVHLNEKHDLLFPLPLPSQPQEQHSTWSEWIPALPGKSVASTTAETGFLLRYRIAIIEPTPAPPSAAEITARREDKARAEFDAIPAGAPIRNWLPYTAAGVRDDFLRAAVENIASRPDFAQELGALMNGKDHAEAASALWVVRHFDSFPPELTAQVSAAGRKIADVIRTFNTTPPTEDPSMELAAQASIRFHSWMEATRTLRERADGDFTAELQEILTLSRVRTDSHAMQADIRRVASYYFNLWARIAPLPGDPSPR